LNRENATGLRIDGHAHRLGDLRGRQAPTGPPNSPSGVRRRASTQLRHRGLSISHQRRARSGSSEAFFRAGPPTAARPCRPVRNRRHLDSPADTPRAARLGSTLADRQLRAPSAPGSDLRARRPRAARAIRLRRRPTHRLPWSPAVDLIVVLDREQPAAESTRARPLPDPPAARARLAKRDRRDRPRVYGPDAGPTPAKLGGRRGRQRAAEPRVQPARAPACQVAAAQRVIPQARPPRRERTSSSGRPPPAPATRRKTSPSPALPSTGSPSRPRVLPAA